MKYTFWSRDYFSNQGDYDFSREHYVDLLDHCFRECIIFSFQFRRENQITKVLKQWEIDNPGFVFQNETHPLLRHYYRVEHAAHSFLLSISSSVFDFYYSFQHPYPEDLAFYRADGSIFLDSIAHEGECSIFPHHAAEVESITRHGHWLYMHGGDCFEEGVPSVPAKEHLLSPRVEWKMLKDPMFNALNNLRKMPKQFIRRSTISELMLFVEVYLTSNSHPKELQLPSGAPPYIPQWWKAFRLYILGVCESNTNEDIIIALQQAGFGGEEAFARFFNILDSFVSDYVKHCTE